MQHGIDTCLMIETSKYAKNASVVLNTAQGVVLWDFINKIASGSNFFDFILETCQIGFYKKNSIT